MSLKDDISKFKESIPEKFHRMIQSDYTHRMEPELIVHVLQQMS